MPTAPAAAMQTHAFNCEHAALRRRCSSRKPQSGRHNGLINSLYFRSQRITIDSGSEVSCSLTISEESK